MALCEQQAPSHMPVLQVHSTRKTVCVVFNDLLVGHQAVRPVEQILVIQSVRDEWGLQGALVGACLARSLPAGQPHVFIVCGIDASRLVVVVVRSRRWRRYKGSSKVSWDQGIGVRTVASDGQQSSGTLRYTLLHQRRLDRSRVRSGTADKTVRQIRERRSVRRRGRGLARAVQILLVCRAACGRKSIVKQFSSAEPRD